MSSPTLRAAPRIAAFTALLLALLLWRVSAIEHIAQAADPSPLVSATAVDANNEAETFSTFIVTGGLVPDTVPEPLGAMLARAHHPTRELAARF